MDISVEELKRWRDEERPHMLIDVREDSEYAQRHIEGAEHIPLGTLQFKLDTLPTDRTIVVHCQSGGRSARATALLRSRGLDARNLAGGILAWLAQGE